MAEDLENKEVKQENNSIPEVLTPAQAINVLIQAAQIGQNKGVYSLQEAFLIYKAIKTFEPKSDNKE